MAAPAVLAGYIVERHGGVLVFALPSAIDEVRSRIAASGTLYNAAVVAGGPSFTGRGAAYRLRTSAGDWLVRHYHRGGIIARIMGDRYLRRGELRPLRELRASTVARARGVATPEVICVVIHPAGPFYRADIATAFIEGGRDLADITFGPQRADASQREAAWRAAGRAIRVAFSAGLVHADLNLRNILIADSRAFILDLDRARVLAHPVSDAARKTMIERFHRSRRKQERLTEHHVTHRELAAFDAGLGDD